MEIKASYIEFVVIIPYDKYTCEVQGDRTSNWLWESRKMRLGSIYPLRESSYSRGASLVVVELIQGIISSSEDALETKYGETQGRLTNVAFFFSKLPAEHTLTGFYLSPPPVGHTYPSLQSLPKHLPVSRLVESRPGLRPHFNTSRPRPALRREIPSCATRRIPTNRHMLLDRCHFGLAENEHTN